MAFVHTVLKILFSILLPPWSAISYLHSFSSVDAACDCWRVHDFTSSTSSSCALSIPSELSGSASASSHIVPLLTKQGVTNNFVDTGYYDTSPRKHIYSDSSSIVSFGFGREVGGGPDAIYTLSLPKRSSIDLSTCVPNGSPNMVQNSILSIYNISCLHTGYTEMASKLLSVGTSGSCGQDTSGMTWSGILPSGNYTIVVEPDSFDDYIPYDSNSYPRGVVLSHSLKYECPCGYSGTMCELRNVPSGFSIGAPLREGTVASGLSGFSDLFDIDLDGRMDALFSITVPFSNMDVQIETCFASTDGSLQTPSVSLAMWRFSCFAVDMDPLRDVTTKTILCTGGVRSVASMLEGGNYALAYKGIDRNPFSLSWKLQCSCGFYHTDCSQQVFIESIARSITPSSSSSTTSLSLSSLPLSFLSQLGSSPSSYGALIKFGSTSTSVPVPAYIIVTGLCFALNKGLIVRAFSSTLTTNGECFRQDSILNEIRRATDLSSISSQQSTSYNILVRNAWKFLVSANGTSSFVPNVTCNAVFYLSWTDSSVSVPTGDIFLSIQDKISRSIVVSWSASCPCYTFGSTCSVQVSVKVVSTESVFSSEAAYFEDTVGRYTFSNDAGSQTTISNPFGGPGVLSLFVLKIPPSRTHIQQIVVTTCHPETTAESTKIYLSLSCPAGGSVESAAYLDVQSTSTVDSDKFGNCAFAKLHFSGSASLDDNTNAVHVLVSSTSGTPGQRFAALYYSFECECGFGGPDCSTPILPRMFTQLSLGSSSLTRSMNSNIVSAYSRGEVSFDTGNTSISIDLLSGILGKETFFNLSIPFGLPSGTRLQLHACSSTGFDGRWPTMWMIVNERAAQCLAGGVSIKEYNLVTQSSSVDQGCAQIEIVDPLPANYIVVINAYNLKGKLHFDLICPCGYAGLLCERIPSLPSIPSDLPSSGEVRGSTSMSTLTVTTGELTSYKARYELNLDVPALLTLSTCNLRSMLGFDGKKGLGTTSIQLFALCTDSGVPVDVSSDEFPTEFYINEDRYYYASDSTGKDVFAQCFQATGSFDPGLYHLVASPTTEGAEGVFSIDYSISFPCPCGQLGPTCTDEPVSIVPLLGFGGVTKGNVGLANNQSVYDSAYYTISTPADFNATTMSISLDVCNSYTFAGAFDLELHLFSRCIAGGQSGQVVALAQVPLAGAVLADVISADSPTAQGMCGKGILAGLGSRLETGILTLEARTPPYTDILDQNRNSVFRGNQVYGVEVRPGPGTMGGAFELAYRVACRCGLFGDGCRSQLPVIHATTPLGIENNVEKWLGLSLSTIPAMFVSHTSDREAYFSYSVKSAGSLPPAMLNLTLCTSNSLNDDEYYISMSLFGPWGCPAGYRSLDSSNPVEKTVNITSHGIQTKCVSASIFPVYAYTNVWALLQTQTLISSASLKWEASCPCFYYGESCESPIPVISLENETMSLVATYEGKSRIVTSESMIKVFGKADSFEAIFTWPFPVETMRTSSFHMESLFFSSCSPFNDVNDDESKSNGWAARTAIYVVSGCVSGGYKDSTFFPVGAGPRLYGHIFDQAPSFFNGPSPGNQQPCSSLTLSKTDLIDSFMADVNLTVIIESTVPSFDGIVQLSWEYTCECGWSGPGCSLPVSVIPLAWTSAPETAATTMYSNVISWQPAGLQTDVFGSKAGDRVFSLSWEEVSMAKQEWIRISACFRSQRFGNKTIAFDSSKIAIHVLRNTTQSSPSSVSCLGGGRQRSSPFGAIIASFPNADGELTSSGENARLVKLPSMPTAMSTCNWAIELPRPALPTDYFVIVEDTSLTPDSSVTIDLIYRKSCACGYGGPDCSTPLSFHELGTFSGSLTVALHQDQPHLIDGLGMNGSFALAHVRMPDDGATRAGNTSFRVSTCNAASAYGVRDTVIRVFSTCFGGGRDMIEIDTFKPPFSIDDTDDCSFATLYSKPVTAPRSQLTNRYLDGRSLASFAGRDVYLMLQSFDMFHNGILQLDYFFTCSPYIFGDSSLSSCSSPGTVSSLPFQSLSGSGEVRTSSASRVPGFSNKVSLYEIKATFDPEQHREPPAWTNITVCNSVGNEVLDVKKSNQPWSGFVNRSSLSSHGSCHSTSFAPLTTSVNIAVETLSSPLPPLSSFSMNWKVSCDCHYDSINVSAPSCTDLMYTVLGDSNNSKIMWPYSIIDSGSVDVYSNTFGPFEISTGLGGSRNQAVGFGINRWNGHQNSNSPELVATFANPSLDVNSQIGNYQDSAHNQIARLILSTCYPGTTAGGGDTKMWAMKKCVAGTSDKGKSWYPSLENLGVMQFNDDIDSEILSKYFPTSSLTNTKCSALVFNSDVLDNLDYRYLDFVIEPKLNDITTGTIQYGLQFICKCGMFGYDCKTEGVSVTHTVSWHPLSHTSLYEFDPQEGRDLWKTPQDLRSKNDQILLYTIPDHVKSVIFTTCDDSDSLNKPNGQLYLFKGESSSSGFPCFAGGESFSRLPLLSSSFMTNGSTCGTIKLTANLVNAASIKGDYRLFVSSSGDTQFDYFKFNVRAMRECDCGWGGEDCSIASSAEADLIGLSGVYIGSTVTSPRSNSSSLFRWTTSAGSGKTTTFNGVSMGGSGNTSVLRMVVSLDTISALEIHTCHPITRDGVTGLVRSFIGLYKSDCIALGTTPESISSTLIAASDGSQQKPSYGPCAVDTFPTRIEVLNPLRGVYTVAVTGYGSLIGDYGLSYYQRCKCNFLGVNCDQPAPSAPSLIDSNYPIGNAAGGIVGSLALQVSPSMSLLNLEGMMVPAWMFQIRLLSNVALDKQEIRVSTCDLIKADVSKKAPLTIGLAPFNSVCLASGTPLSKYSSTMLSSPSTSSDSCSDLTYSASMLNSTRDFSLFLSYLSSSAPSTGTFLAEYYAGCKCGLFTPTCSSARQIFNLSPTEVTVSSISVNVPNAVEWTQAYQDPLFASGHAYLMVDVPVNSISTTITTCTTETASSIVDTHLRISFRCPSASTYIEGNEYLIDTNDDTQFGSYCSTVVAGSEAASNTIYAVVQAGKFAAKDESKRLFGATVKFDCACGWSGAYCNSPFGVRVGCTDTWKNIAGAARCSPSGRLTFPSTWPNVFGFSDGGIISVEEPAAVITLTLSDNAEESLPSTVMISTLDPVTSDPTAGLVKTSMWVYKGCARGGVPLREQTWTLVANSNGTGLIPDSSTVILTNPTDRVYYVVVKGRQGSANAGKMKQFGLTWTQVLPTPSPSPFPTYRPPYTSSLPTSPTASVIKNLLLKSVPSINNGPIDTSFFLLGSQNEDIAGFPLTMSNLSGITYHSNLATFPSTSIVVSSGSYLSTPIISSYPSGSSPFTVSSWVKCIMPSVEIGLNGSNSSSSSITSKRALVAVSWGEARSATDLSSVDSVILSVNEIITQATVTTLIGKGFGEFVDDGGVIPNSFPQQIVADSQGNVYDCSTNRIRKISTNGKVTHFVGNGNDGALDGAGAEATISSCVGMSFASDYIYVLHQSGIVRKISSQGDVSTLSHASFSGMLTALAVDIFDNIFVSMVMSSNSIHKINPSGQLTIFGKPGMYVYPGSFSDGFGTDASFNHPQGLAADKEGNVYVADVGNYRIRKISSNNYVSTYAGNGNRGMVDGIGTNAMINAAYHIAIDSEGNLFVAEWFYTSSNNIYLIRKITPDRVVTTLAGGAGSGNGYADGIGTNALFSYFSGIAIGNGNIYVADQSCIRKISFSPSLPGPLPVCDATYHHIALTYSGSSSSNILSAYIDGSKVASTTTTFSISSSSSSSSLRIGWNGLSSPNSEFFSGSLSDIRIYNRSLSPTEILSISQPPLPIYALTDNPQPQSESSTYTWKCSAGAYGPTVTLSRSSTDGTWIQSGGTVNCQSCPINAYTYASGLSSCSTCPATATTFISSTLGCRPTKSSYNGPIDTSFFLSGSKDEGISAFMAANAAGATYYDDSAAYPSSALSLSSGVYLTAPFLSSLPSGTSPFSVSSWVQCSASSLSDSNPSSVAISWGEAGATPNVQSVYMSGNGSYTPSSSNVLTQASLSVTSFSRRISPELVVNTFAGSVYSYLDGTGTSSSFKDPYGLVVDKSGNVYVTDYGNHRIRKITSFGVVSTLAGSGIASFGDGLGTNARFNAPIGISIDSSGNLFIADSNNHCIRKLTLSRIVSTIAGSGTSGLGSLLDETGTSARFNRPTGITVDSLGTVAYVLDSGNNRVRKIVLATGVVTTITGNGAIGYLDNSADTSKVVSPPGIVLDSVTGNLFIGDSYNNRIRKISLSSGGAPTTFAGSLSGGLVDSVYPESALFYSPGALAVDSSGSLYVADSWNQRVRKISPSGEVSTIAGSGRTGQDGSFLDGVGTAALFNKPFGIAVDSLGNLYVADSGNSRIRKITITSRIPGPLPVCDSTWHHVALTYSGSSASNILTAYVDGVSVATTFASSFTLFNIAPSSISSSLRIGWNGLTSSNYELFSGSLSDIRIYSRSLTSNEVLLVSNRQSPSAPRLSSDFPPASPSAAPSAGTVLISSSIVFFGATSDAYSDIRSIADLALGLETAIRIFISLTTTAGDSLRVKIDRVTILTTNTIIYRIGSSLRRLESSLNSGRGLQSTTTAAPVTARVDYTVILPSSISSSATKVSTAISMNAFASIVVSQVSSAALSSGNAALSSSFANDVTAEVASTQPSSSSLSSSTLYSIVGAIVGFVFIVSGGSYVYFFVYRARAQNAMTDNNPRMKKKSANSENDDLLTKNWRSPTSIEDLDDFGSGGTDVSMNYDVSSSITSNASRASNPGTTSLSSTPTITNNASPTSPQRRIVKNSESSGSYNGIDDDEILPGASSQRDDKYQSVYNLSAEASNQVMGDGDGQEEEEGGNRVIQVVSSVLDGLSHVAGVIPFVGVALKGISLLMDQVETVYRVSKETEFLVVRLKRLQSVVKKAASDEEFCKQHSGIFENMVATLQKASRKIETITNRGLLGKLVYGESDLEVFAKIDRALTMHLTEFTAAMQAETMGMIRTLYDEKTGRSKKGKIDVEAVVPVEALPPFSMRFKTSDLIFDPPLEKQMLTAPRGSYGVVVFAHWKINNLPCAVKLIPARTPTGAPAFSIMSWLSEAELMRRLREHLNSVTKRPPKNVCVLFGIGAVETTNGEVSHYLVVMERLQGSLRELLDSYLKKGRQPPLDQALNWLRDVAHGISECHDANVVHSDIKAANVLLTKKREAKVGDLGAGRVTRDVSSTASVINSTGGNVVRGSLPWLSSELIEDQSMQPSKASDVYAWASVCWEILSCRIPYHNEAGELVQDLTKLRNLTAIVTGKMRPDLSVLRPDAPSSIVEVMKRAWDPEPRDRPTIDEILETLDAAIASFKQAKRGTSVRAAEAAAADLKSEALLSAAATVEEEDARKAVDDLEALTASLEAARALRIEAIRRKHNEVAEKIRQETEAEQKRLEDEYKLELAAEVKLNESQLKLRKAQWMGEIAQAKDLRLRNASRLDEKDRLQILAEFESEQRSVEQRVEAVRAEQSRALEDRLRARKEAKRKAADDKQKQLDEETDLLLQVEKSKDCHEYLLD